MNGDDDLRLVWNGALHRWSPKGYVDPVSIADEGNEIAVVITPSLSVSALRHGYPVEVHPSVGPSARAFQSDFRTGSVQPSQDLNEVMASLESTIKWWVEPGRLLAGEYPGARTPEKARQKVRLIVDAGIDTIIDLTTPRDGLEKYEEALTAVAEQAGRQVRYYAYPIPDMGVLDGEGYDEIVARIRDEMDAGRVVYVHCWGGKGRTSTVVGCLLIDGGLDYDVGIARIAELRAGTRKAIDACPESPSQHRLLRAMRPRCQCDSVRSSVTSTCCRSRTRRVTLGVPRRRATSAITTTRSCTGRPGHPTCRTRCRRRWRPPGHRGGPARRSTPRRPRRWFCRSGSAGWWSRTISPDGVSWSCSNCATIFTRTP